MRTLLGSFLNVDFRTFAVPDAASAFKWLMDGNMPDAILLDINLPDMSGKEVLKYVKTSGILRHLPVIIVSGESDLDTEVECKQLGADGYLVKPFDPLSIKQMIQQLIIMNTNPIDSQELNTFWQLNTSSQK